jgi:hypothetical protein
MAELPIVERLRGRKDGDVALTCREVIEAAELIENLYEALTIARVRLDEYHGDEVGLDFIDPALALAKGEK